ncbi:MAG: hypothetical protein ABJB11_03555 [Ferruginibacter sp.]
MKIEHLIVQHLYKTKKVTLQGIGTFTLNPSISLPDENDKDKHFELPDNAIEFDYNLKAVEDDELIKYIVAHTNKILPLASADLDSYVMLAKQFLNIGKPLVIEGVGTIQKNQVGKYQFIPGHFITPRIDDFPKQLREKRDETVTFESEPRINNSRRNLMIFFTLLVIVSTVFGIYYFVTHRTPTEYISLPVAENQSTNDSTFIDSVKQKLRDTVAVNTVAETIPVPSTTQGFKIILKNYNTEKSVKAAYDRLRSYGHKVEIITIDSANYQLAIPLTTPLSDTTRAKDSLREFFGGRPFVKL